MKKNKPYFAKYLPVEGEIKEGDWIMDSLGVRQLQTEQGLEAIKDAEHIKKAKLFLCSRDIQVGDDIQYPNGIKIQKNNMEQKDIDIMKLLPNGPFKIIGEILTPNIKEGQEFTYRRANILKLLVISNLFPIFVENTNCGNMERYTSI